MTAGAAAMVAALLLMGLGYAMGGPFGVVVAAVAVVAASLLGLRSSAVWTPAAGPAAGEPEVARPSGRIARLERIWGMVAWAPVAGRHFEHGARRLARQLLAARLAERRGIDLSADPAAARTLVGERLWPLVDPAVSYAAEESGVDLRTLDELVTMLEEL